MYDIHIKAAYNLCPLLTRPVFYRIMISALVVPVICVIVLTALTLRCRHMAELPGVVKPIKIPVHLPYVGHGLSFFSTRPHNFWRWVAAYQSGKRDYTLSVLGLPIQVISTPAAVKSLMEMRHLGNDFFARWVVKSMLGLPSPDADIFRSEAEGFKSVFRRYILKTDSTSELLQVYQQQLCHQLSRYEEQFDIKLSSWVYHQVFNASVNTVFGTKLLQIYPQLEKDLLLFKENTMCLLAGLPRWLFPAGYTIRDKILVNFQEFHRGTLGIGTLDASSYPDILGWQPSAGSRMWRGLHRWYGEHNMTPPARAGLDLGILIATTSNSIPACIWMLMHILDTKSNNNLLVDVLNELAPVWSSKNEKYGKLSPTKLPLLQSIYLEVLRLYTEGLIIRRVDNDLKFTLDPTTNLVVNAGVVAASTWLSHHSNDNFTSPPADIFYAKRFVSTDPDSGERMFKPGDIAGKFFPYSGGESICPGRNFAKHEIIWTVAAILMTFDVEFLEYVDNKGTTSNKFPYPVAYHLSAGVMCPDGDIRLQVKRRTV